MGTTQEARATRSGDGRAHVRQYLLPRQAAAPEGPVDVHMMYVMHHAFRRDLAMFADAAAVTPADDRGTWTALARRWAVFSEVLHHHHAGEDAGLWPRLMSVATPEEQSTLEDMEAEHALIDPILTSCADGFDQIVKVADQGSAQRLARELAEQLTAARDCLAAHLLHEETEAMALVQKYLTTEDWHELEETHFRGEQSFRLLVAAVPWVLHELPEELGRKLVTEAGLPMRLLWKATRRRFERLDARARTHLDR
jgi:hemerythrin-like domain-containing protein